MSFKICMGTLKAISDAVNGLKVYKSTKTFQHLFSLNVTLIIRLSATHQT